MKNGMPEGMPDMSMLKNLQGDIEKMLKSVTKQHKDDVDAVVQLSIKPETQKSIKINGVDVLLQMFQDNVRVVFPTKELTQKYYDDFNNEFVELEKLTEKWLLQGDHIKVLKEDNEDLKNQLGKIWLREKQFITYNNLPWYKRLKKWQSK